MNDEVNTTRLATLGFLAAFPGLRVFVLFVAIFFAVVGGIVMVGNTPLSPLGLLVAMFGGILFFALWLPAKLLAMFAQRVKDNLEG